jgi:hypothetical protein
MASSPKPYRRLPGSGYRHTVPGWAILLLFFVIGIFALLFRGRRVQLWQGAEHVLLVEWDGAREHYKRFDYRDVQAFTVLKTNEGKILNAILGTVLCVLAVLAIASSGVGLRVSLLVLAGIFGVILIFNALAGPTCQCSIRTAVQTDELPSLTRLRRARKVLARLRPLITQAQGQLTPEEIPDRMREWVEASVTTGGSTASSPRYVVDDPNVPPRIIV